MRSAAILQNGDRLAKAASRFEISHQNNHVGDVGNVDIRRRDADRSLVRNDQESRDALFVKIRQKFMQMQHKMLFLRHRGEVAVQTVDDDHAAVLRLHFLLQAMGEFAGRELGRINLANDQASFVDMSLQIETERLRTQQKRAGPFIELIDRATIATAAGCVDILQGDRRLAGARRPGQQGARAAGRSAMEKRIQFGHAARRRLADLRGTILGSDEPWENIDAALADDKIVITPDEGDAAQFLNFHAPPCRAELERHPLQGNDAVAKTVEMVVSFAVQRGQIVDEKHGRVATGEKLFERQNLTTVAQRVLSQKTQFREAVEHDSVRLDPLDFVTDQLDGAAELQFPGMENGLLALPAEHLFGGRELEDVEGFQRPAMRRRNDAYFFARLRKRYIKPPLAMTHALEQKLEGQGRLARTRRALEQINPISRQPAA